MTTGGADGLGEGTVLPRSTRGRWFVGGVLFLALALRLGVVAWIHDTYVPMTDAAHMDDIATSMANGHGYGNFPLPPATGPGAYRSPAYPAVLAVAYAVAGDHSWKVGLAQNALIGTVLVGMVGVVAAQLWSRRVAAIAMALAAAHPTLVLVGSSLQLEPLLVTLSLGSLAAALQHRRAPRGLLWPVAAGVLLGSAILTRELAFALVPPIAWVLWPPRAQNGSGRSRRAVLAPVAAVVVAAAVVLPWTIRNAARFDSFVPVSSSSGFGLAGTFSASADAQRGRWLPPYEDPEMGAIILSLEDPDEVDIDKALRDASIEYIVDHPTYMAELAFFGTIRLFDLDGGAYDRFAAQFVPYPKWLTWLSVLATYPLIVAAAIGALSSRARRVPLAVWAIPILIYVEIALLLPANVRYRASIDPFLLFLASLALLPVVERVGRARGWLAPDA